MGRLRSGLQSWRFYLLDLQYQKDLADSVPSQRRSWRKEAGLLPRLSCRAQEKARGSGDAAGRSYPRTYLGFCSSVYFLIHKNLKAADNRLRLLFCVSDILFCFFAAVWAVFGVYENHPAAIGAASGFEINQAAR